MQAESNRVRQIRQICTQRNITELAHFTRIENLRSILLKGLLSRERLETCGQEFLFNDRDRFDGCKNGICLSLSFPNYKMFYSIREKKKEEEVCDSHWVVLILDTKVLWESDCAFCQENASSNRVRHFPLEEKKRLDALQSLFVEVYHDVDGKGYSRQSLAIPTYFPTNPQAEILVFDFISSRYINEIVFWDCITLRQWRSDNPAVYTQRFYANKEFFYPRCDHKFWTCDDL